MSEPKGNYEVTRQEVDDASEMLGAGYDEVRVKDQSNDKRYFTITPRIVKAYARTPHDLALWETVKDIAGEDGECYLNTEQLAILCGASAGQVSNSRKYWLKIGFLKGEIRKDPGYSQAVWHLTVPDIWKQNVEWCEKHPKIEDRLAFRKAHKSLHTVKPSYSEGKPSPSETKKMLIKKNHKRGDLVDAYLILGKPSESELETEAVLDKLERELKVNLARSNANQVIARKILKEEKDGKPLDTFLKWLKSDEWRLSHLYTFADLAKLWQIFPQAFSTEQTGMRGIHAL